ncbi:hypothetical protein ACFLV7_14840 [Chloroflexota bacterium]
MFTKVVGTALITLLLFSASEGLASKLGQDTLLFETAKIAHAMDPVPSDDPPLKPYGRETRKADDPEYVEAIERTAAMVWNENAQYLAGLYGFHIVNVTWEDTGRYYNSSVGPNISDVTIQVQHQDPYTSNYELTLMPVIRHPNFSDLTADISLDRFYLLVGNEQGKALHKITLREYLGDISRYLSEPGSWVSRESSLLAKRDTHVLVSAQAAFLPVPQKGKAEFNPVIFNYQSYQGDPAVLVIVATREGTSATVIDNYRDAFPAGFSWGQRLFFNQDGERASFTGERLSDFRPREMPRGDKPQTASERGLNMVMIIQVPLKQKHPMDEGLMLFEEAEALDAAPMESAKSNVETAVIGHGEVEGPYTEIDGLKIERDERFPIRVTVQFYKATSNGVVSSDDMEEIADQIERVYSQADYVGSLVVGGESYRPTEYEGPKIQPADWWEGFWTRFENNTGLDRYDAYDLWRALGVYAGKWVENIR